MDVELPPPPVEYGKRLLPTLIDDTARDDPGRIFAVIAKTVDIEDGFIDVSYRRLSTAINSCAWWMETKLGRNLNFATIAYIGPLDLLYHIVTLAAIKTGNKVEHQNS